MHLVPDYPDSVAPDTFIENLLELLRDEEYQAEAYAHFSTEPYEPYKLVSESAAFSEGIPIPALLVRDVTAEEDDDYPRKSNVIRLSLYPCLAAVATNLESSDALMREAYRRNDAVALMIRSAKKSGFDLFKNMNISMGKDVQVKRRSYGETVPGQASYRRYPSTDVEVRFEESP